MFEICLDYFFKTSSLLSKAQNDRQKLLKTAQFCEPYKFVYKILISFIVSFYFLNEIPKIRSLCTLREFIIGAY